MSIKLSEHHGHEISDAISDIFGFVVHVDVGSNNVTVLQPMCPLVTICLHVPQYVSPHLTTLLFVGSLSALNLALRI